MKHFVLCILLLAVVTCSQAHEVITICSAPLAPYAYLKDGVPAGIDVAVAKAVFGKLGVPFNVDIEPFARCQRDLTMGLADVGFAFSNTPERQTFAYFPKNYVWRISYVFFTNQKTKQNYDIRGLDDAKKSRLRIGIVRGASYHENFWATFPSQDPSINDGYYSHLIPAADTAANIHQLELDHTQLFPQDLIAGLWTAKQAGYTRPYYFDTVLFSKDYHHIFSKASGFANRTYPNILALMEDYDAELAEFKKTDQYRSLVKNMD